jgi:aminocarboxymuconate-semialdehyde decarboxylase
VPLFLHPYRVLGAERLARDFLSNVCGNPFETTVAALSLFFGGVFDRHPGLVVLLAHAGGSLPVLAGRAVHACRAGAATRRPVDAVEEILGCFYYDTVLHDPAALAYAVSRLGPDRMVLGTDYPFPMLVDDPAAMVRAAVAGAPAGAFEQITSSGPRRLVGR